MPVLYGAEHYVNRGTSELKILEKENFDLDCGIEVDFTPKKKEKTISIKNLDKGYINTQFYDFMEKVLLKHGMDENARNEEMLKKITKIRQDFTNSIEHLLYKESVLALLGDSEKRIREDKRFYPHYQYSISTTPDLFAIILESEKNCRIHEGETIFTEELISKYPGIFHAVLKRYIELRLDTHEVLEDGSVEFKYCLYTERYRARLAAGYFSIKVPLDVIAKDITEGKIDLERVPSCDSKLFIRYLKPEDLANGFSSLEDGIERSVVMEKKWDEERAKSSKVNSY